MMASYTMVVVLWDKDQGCWVLRGGDGDTPTGERDPHLDPFMLASAAQNSSRVDVVQVWSESMCLVYHSHDKYSWLRSDALSLYAASIRAPGGAA